MSKSNKSLSSEQLHELIKIHLGYVKSLNEFKSKNKINVRMPNFPEIISENIIKHFIINNENRNCNNATSGDLISGGDKIEVKCFSSSGPTSFGPNEKWKELYFLDAIDFNNNKIKIYKCLLSNDSDEFSNIKLNAKETYKQSCSKGKRPRINFKDLHKQLKDGIKEVYNGNLEEVFSKLSVKEDTLNDNSDNNSDNIKSNIKKKDKNKTLTI